MATIKIYNDVLHAIDARIYGHFIEELGECIHDGLWTYSERLRRLPHLQEPLLDGVRQDVFDAVRALLHVPAGVPSVLRWPGGCFADTYHWKDGIGPRMRRPLRRNGHWDAFPIRLFRSEHGVPGPRYNNHFGTDEFLGLCERIAVEPYITVNYGTGTPEEAADWVEYVNGHADTHWGGKRAAVHPQPYNVRTWGIGNEVWARWERGRARSARDYASRYLQFAKAMRQRDPSIQLVACGVDPGERHFLLARDAASWNRTLLETAGDYVDFLSLHTYVPLGFAPLRLLRNSPAYARTEEAYEAIAASPVLVGERLQRMWNEITDTLGEQTPVRIAFDEWNLWYCFNQVIKANYTLADGLWVAGMLHELQKHAPVLGMANLAQMVNTLGLIRTDDAGVVLTPGYHAFRLLRQQSGEHFLKVDVDCATYRNKKTLGIDAGETPDLSCSATASASGDRVALSVVNRQYRNAVRADVQLEGFVNGDLRMTEAHVLSHDDPFAMNTPENRDRVQPRPLDTDALSPASVELLPHSLSVFVWERRDRPAP
jgi:alpha-N-arabinofuranosidase